MKKNKTLIFLALLLSSCGIYSFRGNLPAHINSVAIPAVINQTAEIEVADLTIQLVTEYFVAENVIRVASEGNADSDLQITISRITDRPSTFTLQERVEEWRIDITAKVVWYDLKNNKPLFEKDFSRFAFYPPGGDIGSDGVDNDEDGSIDESDEVGDPRTFAIRTTIQKISEDILNEVVSTW